MRATTAQTPMDDFLADLGAELGGGSGDDGGWAAPAPAAARSLSTSSGSTASAPLKPRLGAARGAAAGVGGGVGSAHLAPAAHAASDSGDGDIAASQRDLNEMQVSRRAAAAPASRGSQSLPAASHRARSWWTARSTWRRRQCSPSSLCRRARRR